MVGDCEGKLWPSEPVRGAKTFVTNVTPDDIERSLKCVAKEDQHYQVPDALGLQDYLHRPDLLWDLAVKRGAVHDLSSWQPWPYRWFPYPKLVGGYRQMTTADVVDRVIFRILAFRAAALTAPALSRRVFGHRLERNGSWSLRPPTSAWLNYRHYQLTSLVVNDWGYTCISDLSGFYLAIDTDRMCNTMRANAVPEDLVGRIEQLLWHWQKEGGLSGLPVGGEASGVLSNVYLLPVDRLLGGCACDHAMYGDDFAVFDVDITFGQAVIAVLDEHLNNELSLTRNVDKTMEFFDAVEAARHIQNNSLASIEAVDQIDDDIATEMLYDLWDERVMLAHEPNMTEVLFALSRLGKRRDPYAAPGLLACRDLLQSDPKSTIDYLCNTVSADQDVAEELCSLLAVPPTATTEALHLHICRFLASAERTSTIGAETERVLDDTASFRGMTRAMAAQARRRCPGWRYDDAIDRADAEREFTVWRSLIGTTKGMVDHVRTRRLALHELARRDPALSATATWALAA